MLHTVLYYIHTSHTRADIFLYILETESNYLFQDGLEIMSLAFIVPELQASAIISEHFHFS